jgi:hypothetical protein
VCSSLMVVSTSMYKLDVSKLEQRDAVAKYVVNPSKANWLGRNHQIRMQKPLIEAVARTKHQAMLSEADWLFVAVFCQVPNDKDVMRWVPRRPRRSI